MSNAWDDVRAALATAKQADEAISHHAERMAEMLNRNGNLRRVSAYELARIKRELRNFDIHRGKWKR